MGNLKKKKEDCGVFLFSFFVVVFVFFNMGNTLLEKKYLRRACRPAKTLPQWSPPPYLVINRPLLQFVISHLVLLAPGSGCFGILHRSILLWGEFRVRGSFTDCPFSSESVTFKKGRELENMHLPSSRQFSL